MSGQTIESIPTYFLYHSELA